MATAEKTSPNAKLAAVHARSRKEWRTWLETNHERNSAISLVYPKKGSAAWNDLTYDAIVEEALCFGWIDSVAHTHDEAWSMLRMSPRKAGSGWSKKNKDRIARLVREGQMTPAGLAKIAAAKRDGSWSALDAVEALTVPNDLAKALARNAAAKRHFAAFPPSSRKMILTWIATAKRPETRARRIDETVRLAAQGRRANQDRE